MLAIWRSRKQDFTWLWLFYSYDKILKSQSRVKSGLREQLLPQNAVRLVKLSDWID
jgi:hypothetical protein